MKTVILLVALLFGNQALFAQDNLLDHINGKWTGKLLQGSGGLDQQYPFELQLEMVGDEVVGYSKIEWKDYYGEMDIVGRIENGKLILEETEITNQSLSGGRWCMKDMELDFSMIGNTARLSGQWEEDPNANVCRGDLWVEKETEKEEEAIEETKELSINLFPNPTSREITIQLNNPESVSIRVFDSVGQQLQTHNFTNTDRLRLDLENSAAGIYFVEVQHAEGRSVFPVVKYD